MRWKVWSRASSFTAVVCLLALTGCGGGEGCGDGGLAVEGAAPYLRCLAASAPDDAVHRFGSTTLRIRDRGLTFEGLPSVVRIAAFSGPAFARPPDEPQLQRLRTAAPHLVVVLGGLGDTGDLARRTVKALLSLDVPVVILAGGRDSRPRIADAIETAGSKANRITDITALDFVRIGADTFLPVAGAYEGRYALGEDGCGWSAADLEPRAKRLTSAPKHRNWLLAWEAPTSDSALASFAERRGARGGLFGWPYLDVMRPSASGGRRLPFGEAAPDLQLVVPRWSGPAMERRDGSRVRAGFALLELGPDGLRVLDTASLGPAVGSAPAGPNSPAN